jgi:hypothetical protein
MFRVFLVLLLLISSTSATELLRDIHIDTTYVFESDAGDVPRRIDQKDAVLRAEEWATRFYGDALLRLVACQFKTTPKHCKTLRSLLAREFRMLSPDY